MTNIPSHPCPRLHRFYHSITAVYPAFAFLVKARFEQISIDQMFQILSRGKDRNKIARACLLVVEYSIMTLLTGTAYQSLFSKLGFQNENLYHILLVAPQKEQTNLQHHHQCNNPRKPTKHWALSY